jgi:hypothetical protein
MFVGQEMNFTAIARELNRSGLHIMATPPWNARAVQTILTHPRYTGCNLLIQIAALSRGRVTINMSPMHHTRLRLRTGRLVSVIVGLLFEYKGEPVCAELRQIALVARLNERNDAIKEKEMMP